MIRIRYWCEGFDPKYGDLFQGSHDLGIEWNDLVWAAVSVGKLGYDDLMGYGLFSIDEVRFRTYLIYSHLMQDGDRVSKSPLYESLDSTEKGAASYFIGMAISKLIGMFLLGIPWLVHLEKIKALYNIDVKGKSRPDLLGMNPHGKWLVFEAKGRTHGFSQDALARAKSQISQIRHISGQRPTLRVATESFFNPYLSVIISDPNGFSDNLIDMEIDETQFFLSYYSALRNVQQFVGRIQTIGEHHYAFVDVETVGISIGLDRRLLDHLQRGRINRKDIADIQTDMNKLYREDNRSTKCYSDGLAVSLDDRRWASGIMSLEPSKR
mgnify:CR=1 FL=1